MMDAIVLMLMLFPRPPPAYTGGIDSPGSGKKSVGGISPRGLSEGVSPLIGGLVMAVLVRGPPAVPANVHMYRVWRLAPISVTIYGVCTHWRAYLPLFSVCAHIAEHT